MQRRLPPSTGSLLFLLCLNAFLGIVAAYAELSEDFLRIVTVDSADFDIQNSDLLAPLLIPRVPGTPGQAKAQEHFVNFFRRELPKWTIDWQNSTSTTPLTGTEQLPFANLIIRRAPSSARSGQMSYLTLAAHYDSLINPDGFIGATDSAVPCAILMHVARYLERLLEKAYYMAATSGKFGVTQATDLGVQILLLDGEEAFQSWTATDSLYGSRSLAEDWEKNAFNSMQSGFQDPLGQISLFVLLDLIGSAEPLVPSYFLTTHWAYKAMASIEARMRTAGFLETNPQRPFLYDVEKAPNQFRRYGVEDDHIPFMQRGVPILHLIPSPFPPVWHTMRDDGEHLDMPTVRDWAKITTAFALEWLDMQQLV